MTSPTHAFRPIMIMLYILFNPLEYRLRKWNAKDEKSLKITPFQWIWRTALSLMHAKEGASISIGQRGINKHSVYLTVVILISL